MVRTALTEDLAVLLTFEQEIIEAERPFDSTIKEGEVHYYDLRQLIESPQAEVVVAEINQTIIGSGYAVIRTAQEYLKHNRYAYLGFMYVKPEYRGKGVNKAILEALKQWVIAQEITEIRLEVYEENTIAKNAYQKAGFKAHLLEMRMDVGGRA